MISKVIKRYARDVLGLPVRVRTSPGKAGWIDCWIPPEPGSPLGPLVYKYSFPEDLRKHCIRIVYPQSPTLQAQTSAGNIESHRIALLDFQWKKLLEERGFLIPEQASEPAPCVSTS